MDNLYRGFIGSCFIGIAIGIFLTGIFIDHDGTKFNTMQKAIEDCEKTLPRNKNCKIIAIPDDVINNN